MAREVIFFSLISRFPPVCHPPHIDHHFWDCCCNSWLRVQKQREHRFLFFCVCIRRCWCASNLTVFSPIQLSVIVQDNLTNMIVKYKNGTSEFKSTVDKLQIEVGATHPVWQKIFTLCTSFWPKLLPFPCDRCLGLHSCIKGFLFDLPDEMLRRDQFFWLEILVTWRKHCAWLLLSERQ